MPEPIYVRLKPRGPAQPHLNYGVSGKTFSAGRWQKYEPSETVDNLVRYLKGCKPNGGVTGYPIFEVADPDTYKTLVAQEEQAAELARAELLVGKRIVNNRAPEGPPVLPPSADELKDVESKVPGDKDDEDKAATTDSDEGGLDAVAAELKAAEDKAAATAAKKKAADKKKDKGNK